MKGMCMRGAHTGRPSRKARSERYADAVIWLAAALLVAVGLPGPAWGTVTNVTVSPLGARLPFNRPPAPITLQWKVTTDLGGGTVVTSTVGYLFAYKTGAPTCNPATWGTSYDPTPFGNVNRVLSGVAQLLPGATTPPYAQAVFSETLTVPVAWLVWARDNGYRRLDYIRVFDDGSGNTRCNIVKLYVTAGGGFGAVDFGLSYIRMRFDDGSVARVVPRGGTLKVRAEVRYRGHGLLRAVWEVAEPASTRGGTVVYVPLKTVHRYLSGAGRAVLEGPDLPTSMTGLHLVRLRLVEPAIDAPNLFLRYFVRDPDRAAVRIARIGLEGPPPGVSLDAGTRFAWEPVAGAAAYRIEFYEAPGGFGAEAVAPPPGARPVSGMLLPASERGAVLSALARSGLRGPAAYLWRVVAFDGKGRLVGASPYRRVVVAGDGGAGAGADSDAGGG